MADGSVQEYRLGLQHEGSGERIRRFLDKASRGEPITVSVIGGSGMSTLGRADGSVERTRFGTCSSPHPKDDRQRINRCHGGAIEARTSADTVLARKHARHRV